MTLLAIVELERGLHLGALADEAPGLGLDVSVSEGIPAVVHDEKSGCGCQEDAQDYKKDGGHMLRPETGGVPILG